MKEESTLKKALIDQKISTEEPETKKNDLERVRTYKPKIEVKKDEPIRSALFSQVLSDQGDDTEEIQNLSKQSSSNQSISSSLFNTSSFNPSSTSSLTVSGTSTPTPLSRPVSYQSLYDKLNDVQADQPEPDLSQIEETAEIPQSITDANEAIRLVQDALNSNEETTFETPPKEKTILEPAETTTTILEPSKKEPSLISQQAEEQFTELKSVDGPTSDFVEGALTTPPKYTRAQINDMKVKPLGEVITAEKVKDKQGKRLIFNGTRVFREGKLGTQLDKSELQSIVLSHYGFAD